MQLLGITAAKFLDNHTVLYTSSGTRLGLWDCRVSHQKNTQFNSVLAQQNGQWEACSSLSVQGLDNSTFVAAAGDSGSLSVWDLRMAVDTVSVFNSSGPYDLGGPGMFEFRFSCFWHMVSRDLLT